MKRLIRNLWVYTNKIRASLAAATLKAATLKVMPPKKKTRSVARATTTSAGAGAVTATATSVTAVRNLLKSNLKGPEVPPKNKAISRTKENSATGGDATGGSSECCVCSNHIADGKDDALFCEGVCNGWMHIYCAGVPLKHFERLSLMSSPFLCYTCALQIHEREAAELKSKVQSLAAELEELQKFLHAGSEATTQSSATNIAICSQTSGNDSRGHRRSFEEKVTDQGGDVCVRDLERAREPGRPAGISRGHGIREGYRGDGWRRRGRARGGRMGGAGCAVGRGGGIDSRNSGIREVVSGVRRVWGTVKSSSVLCIKNTIIRLAGIKNIDSIHVKRKYKTTSMGTPRWWYIIHAEEDAILKLLEAQWECIKLQTGWRLESCTKPVEKSIPSHSNHTHVPNNVDTCQACTDVIVPCNINTTVVPTILSPPALSL